MAWTTDEYVCNVIEAMTEAWQFIFNHHPNGDAIMNRVMDQDNRITFGQFRKWYHEARAAL